MNKTAVLTRLQQAGSDTRQLERICLQVALEMIDDGTQPDFAVTSDDFAADPHLICADRYWQQRLVREPTIATAAACAHWIEKHVVLTARPEIEHRWALGNAFVNRDTVESHAELAEATAELLADPATTATTAFFTALYHAGKHRANRTFDELRLFLDGSPLLDAAGTRRNDAALVALRSLAAFGSRAMTVEHATDLLERAWADPDRTRQVTDLCLQAISDSVPFDEQGAVLVKHATEAVAAFPADHMFRYRLASGLHLSGHPDAALAAIDDAIALLPAIGGRISHELLQQQYLTKREAILDGRLRARWAAEQQQRWEAQEHANAAIRETVQSSTVRAVELVAIFTAAIAFAVGSLQVTLNGTLKLHDRMWLLTGLGGGLALFALLTIGGTWLITGRRHRRR